MNSHEPTNGSSRKGLYDDREPPATLIKGGRLPPTEAERKKPVRGHPVSRPWAAIFLALTALYAIGTTAFIAWRIQKARPSGGDPAIGGESLESIDPPERTSSGPSSLSPAAGKRDRVTTNCVQRLRSGELRWREMLREIDRLMDRRLVTEADERLTEAIRVNPGILSLTLRQAELRLTMGDVRKAIEGFVEVLRADPAVLAAREGLALALQRDGDSEGALDAARWVLELDRSRSKTLNVAAEAAIETGYFSEAVGYLRSWLQLEPHSVAAKDLLGLAYLRLEEYGKAGFQLGDLIRQGVGTEATYLNLTLAYAQQKQSKSVADLLLLSSERFDRDHVLAWIGRSDFDEIRSDPVVATVIDRIRQGVSTAQILSLPSANSVPVFEKGIGMMPAPDIGIKPVDLK